MKIFLFAFAAMTLSLGFTSCDDDNDFPKVWTYKSTEMFEFSMYVGSPDGGVKVSTANITPKDIWNDFVLDLSWRYTGDEVDESFTFESDTKGYFTDYKGRIFEFTYKVENDMLYSKFGEDGEWRTDKYSNKNQYVDIHDYFYSNVAGAIKRHTGDGCDLNEALGHVGLASLSDLRNPQDTIVWCNIGGVFK